MVSGPVRMLLKPYTILSWRYFFDLVYILQGPNFLIVFPVSWFCYWCVVKFCMVLWLTDIHAWAYDINNHHTDSYPKKILQPWTNLSCMNDITRTIWSVYGCQLSTWSNICLGELVLVYESRLEQHIYYPLKETILQESFVLNLMTYY